MKHPITTQAQVRVSFWADHPHFKRHSGWKQNQYPVDIRVAFCDWVDHLCRDKQISEELAARVTL